MIEFCFGLSLKQLELNQCEPWFKAIFEQLRFLPFMSIITYYPILTRIFDIFQPKWVQEERIAHCKFAADLVDKRICEGSTYDADLWRLAIDGLSLEEMHSNAEFLFIAGSETSGKFWLCNT
jgi:hypothetical protein